jgi:YesN/AraC family two-component response regulator
VVEANNGAEAFALFLGTQFDLVMTDCEMPFVKGNELAAKIKRVAPQQPILMFTAYEKKPGADNPVDAVLNKPFDSARLRETMHKLFCSAKNATEPRTQSRDTSKNLARS